MANNRYYIECPVCKEQVYMGKSLGNGIYNMRSYQGKFYKAKEYKADAEVLNECYDFMWKHMLACHKDEFKGGELFKIMSEYKNET